MGTVFHIVTGRMAHEAELHLTGAIRVSFLVSELFAGITELSAFVISPVSSSRRSTSWGFAAGRSSSPRGKGSVPIVLWFSAVTASASTRGRGAVWSGTSSRAPGWFSAVQVGLIVFLAGLSCSSEGGQRFLDDIHVGAHTSVRS